MKRRTFLLGGGSALVAWHMQAFGTNTSTSMSKNPLANPLGDAEARAAANSEQARRGHLVIIGGAEDRSGDRLILRRFVELTRRADPRIAVLTAANSFPGIVWKRYDQALADLGAAQREHIDIGTRTEADDAALAERVLAMDGVFLSGGDQRRLMSLIGGTALERAIQQAHRHGACIAGTSAGAAAMSRTMLTGRSLSDGLGLVQHAVIDQHFSQRRRLSRLLMAVAGKQEVIGVGIDEDTALILGPERRVEVLGAGDVTLVDGRRLPQPDDSMGPDALLQMPQTQLTRLTQGAYRTVAGANDDLALRGMLSLL